MVKGEREGWFSGVGRDTVLLALSSLFADISTEMLYPVLPVFLTQTLGAGGTAVGLIEGAATAIQNVTQGLSGALSDRMRRRKPIAIVGYVLAALSKPLIGMAVGWPGVLGARALDRFGTGVRSAPRDALVAASVDAPHRGKAFGLEGAGDNLGAFLGPLIAVLLIAGLGLELRNVFLLAAIPGLLALAMVLLVRERRAGAGAEADAGAKIEAPLGRFPKRYFAYLAVTAVFGLGNSSNAFLILQTRALGADLTVSILIYAAFNLVAALISYPAGYLSDRMSRRDLLAVAFAIYGLSYLGFGLAHGVWLTAGMFVLYGVFAGAFRAVGKALAADLSPEPLRAGGVGWYGATVGVSGLVASLVAGQLWDRVDHAAVFWWGAAFSVLGLLALLALVPRRPDAHVG